MESEKKVMQKAKQERDRLHTRAFLMMLEVALIIAVPAGIIVIIHKTIELQKPVLYTLFGVAFILSWVIIILRVKKLESRLKDLDKKVEMEKDVSHSERAKR